MNISTLWHENNEQKWLDALERYWDFVKPDHSEVEKKFQNIDLEEIERMDENEWFNFLLHEYFFWKFTTPNRYATTTSYLKKYKGSEDSLANLYRIKQELLSFNKNEIETGVKIARCIRGLGPAGASGLLAVLFPEYFATVDQFVAKALAPIDGLPQKEQILKMKPESLRLKDAVILIEIMRLKADELNAVFKSKFWTPRKVDMVLWAIR